MVRVPFLPKLSFGKGKEGKGKCVEAPFTQLMCYSCLSCVNIGVNRVKVKGGTSHHHHHHHHHYNYYYHYYFHHHHRRIHSKNTHTENRTKQQTTTTQNKKKKKISSAPIPIRLTKGAGKGREKGKSGKWKGVKGGRTTTAKEEGKGVRG
jgi:hypothetical protein